MHFDEKADQLELREWDIWYTPPPDMPKDALILDVGGRDGDSCLFYVLRGYTNIRVIEPNPVYFEWLDNNTREMKEMFPAVNIEVRKKPFTKSDLKGVAFAKFDCEGCEQEADLESLPMPWSAEVHVPNKPDANGFYPYVDVVGYRRGAGLSKAPAQATP